MCHINALRAVGAMPEGAYVEGYIVGNDRCHSVVEHAWIASADRVIVDPTLPHLEQVAQSWTYFPVFQWSMEELWSLFDRHGDTLESPVRQYLPMWGEEHESWLHATVAAWRHRSALHLKRTGKPLIAPADEEPTPDGIVGRYWLERAGRMPPDTRPAPAGLGG